MYNTSHALSIYGLHITEHPVYLGVTTHTSIGLDNMCVTCACSAEN